MGNHQLLRHRLQPRCDPANDHNWQPRDVRRRKILRWPRSRLDIRHGSALPIRDFAQMDSWHRRRRVPARHHNWIATGSHRELLDEKPARYRVLPYPDRGAVRLVDHHLRRSVFPPGNATVLDQAGQIRGGKAY